MPVNLTIQAEVVDISSDQPREDDVFFVDTNVWYWMTYTKASASGARPYQVQLYPTYANKALSAKSQIFQSGLSLAELSHLIEKAEREIFSASNPGLTPKEYRHNFPLERKNVCLEVEAACTQVVALADSLDTTIDAAMSNAIVDRFAERSVDGYDVFILESMKSRSIAQIITDDGDFSTVPGLRLFTANRSVIDAARQQNRLVVR